MQQSAYSLDDKYTQPQGHLLLTGLQALVRLPMLQRQRDQALGLNTAGFISGYRGSPLGGLDLALWRAEKHLQANDIRFQPGLNEDLAATACWGTQQVGLFPDAKVDGVFALWYGKGPGVDRSGDVLKHGNVAGSSRFGGVLCVAGDDHACKSSTFPHQSDHAFSAAMIPVLAPSSVQEFLDFGLHGWAMSRYSGCWVALKVVSDTVESTAVVEVDPQRVQVVIPSDFVLPEGGVHLRWPDPSREQELRLLHHRLYAALAYARANRLDRIVIDSPHPRLGIATSGKAYLDVMQALDDLGITETLASEIGLRIYKVGMTWPLESEGVHQFAAGLSEILVIEEKRQVIEYQLKEQLYNWREDVRPRVIGKFDEKGEWALPHGEWLLPAAGEFTPAMVARVIASRLQRFWTSQTMTDRLAFLDFKERMLAQPRETMTRKPYYCSGCPHNSSTRVPEGSRAVAGIGCHYMATWIYPQTQTFSQMGGEGVAWIGQSGYTQTPHIFANLGDGTYFHSGSLAIRASVAAGVSITYKILFNDAVAMTGGQPVDGQLSVPQIAWQVAAEGVKRIVVMSDDLDKYWDARFPDGVELRSRDDLDAVQRALRQTVGVSVLIYDQTCAAEKRRRRKRGTYPEAPRRVFINQRVCEGCGDCSESSNCLSVTPVETELGRKRAIDQSSCNMDYTCLKGFCPSMVTVEGAKLRKPRSVAAKVEDFADLPMPPMPDVVQPYGILITGVGGMGVVTIGALLATAAHLEGKGVTVMDMTGLAQKGGAVFCHVRICQEQDKIHAVRIAAGEAQVVLGGDLLVTADNEALSRMAAGLTTAIVNAHETPTGEFIHNPDLCQPVSPMEDTIRQAVGEEHVEFLDATRLATLLMADAIDTHLFLLGYAWQRGLIPLEQDSLLQAITLNGTAVDASRLAFLWGRRAAYDLRAVERLIAATHRQPESAPQTLDTWLARRCADLTAYQNARYAARYRALVDRVRAAERALGKDDLAWAVARQYYRLLAYKDEYEVARLYTDGEFQRELAETFEDGFELSLQLAPPLMPTSLYSDGKPKKHSFGGWMMPVLKLLRHGKALRGTPFDPFRYTADRRLELQLLTEYESTVDSLVTNLTALNHALAVVIARLPEQIRGFGPIKRAAAESVAAKRAELMAAYEGRKSTTKAQPIHFIKRTAAQG